MKSLRYKIGFRKKILRKFNNRCSNCNSIERLHVHHLKSRASNPELIFDESNVTVLCEPCHVKLHQKKLELKTNFPTWIFNEPRKKQPWEVTEKPFVSCQDRYSRERRIENRLY